MRLIDADMIEPHEQLESLGNGQYEYVRVAYMDDIDALPTVDAVEVVRCRDCKWFEDANDDCGTCGFFEDARSANHFCGEGERKDGEHDRG